MAALAAARRLGKGDFEVSAEQTERNRRRKSKFSDGRASVVQAAVREYGCGVGFRAENDRRL